MKLEDIKDEKGLIAFGEAFIESSAKRKRKIEQQWLLNISNIAGDQLVKVNPHTGSLDRIKVEHDPDWMVRIVDNRILPIYRTMVAKLTKNNPLPSAKATSREESDIQAARAAVKLLENHWGTLNLSTIHLEAVAWLVATGNVFYKQYWNPKRGERIIDEKAAALENMDTEAGLTQEGLPQPKAEPEKVDFNLGDTDLILRSSFNIYPQPGKTKMRDMKIIADAEVMDVEEVEKLYGKKVEPEKDTRFTKIQNTISNTIESGTITEQESENSVTVKEIYILPCTVFPNGAKYAWAKQTLLYFEEECLENPITHIGLIEVPGRFWYKGIVDDCIPLQKRWNHLLSKIEMHNDYYNDPPIIVDGQIIPTEEWTTEPGLILESKQSGADLSRAMHKVEVPQLDQSIFKELEILDAQFEIVPVMNKVSFGKDTANATSGRAINFLQEKDDDVVRPLVTQIESGYAEVFKKDFKLCQDNYAEDRGFAIVGEDNKVEWIEFTKANLEAGIDVGVEPGSAMPRSKVAQQAMVMDMLTAGFFTNPQTGTPDFAKALKYMEFGSVDDIYQDNALDSNQAKRENEKMKDGGDALAEDWHNHETHIYEHNRLRKTADYDSYPDEIKQKFTNHIAEHMQFMQPPAQEPQVPPDGPPPEEIIQFLEDLKQNDPEALAQLMALPEDERDAAVLKAYSAGQQ